MSQVLLLSWGTSLVRNIERGQVRNNVFSVGTLLVRNTQIKKSQIMLLAWEHYKFEILKEDMFQVELLAWEYYNMKILKEDWFQIMLLA